MSGLPLGLDLDEASEAIGVQGVRCMICAKWHCEKRLGYDSQFQGQSGCCLPPSRPSVLHDNGVMLGIGNYM